MPSLPRIGDLLVEAGAITHIQLSEALQAQRERGGRLGTNLIELGFIDEKKLAGVLARQLSIPSATSAQLDRLDAAALKRLGAKTAERLRAIPIREDKGKLWVAVADPTDPRVIEQLEKAVGMPVRPMVAPEMLLAQALEKHYGVARKPRAGKKSSRLNNARVDKPQSLIEIGTMTSLGAPLPPPPPPIPVYSARPNPSTGELDKVAAYLDEPAEAKPRPPPRARMSMREVTKLMAEAKSDELIVEAALRYLAEDAQKSVALVLRAGQLSGVRAMGVNSERVRAATLPIDASPLVASVLATGEAWTGRCFADELGGTLVALLGVQREALAIVLPLRIGKRPAGAIVAVNASNEALRNKPDFDRLAQKIDYALHISVLRRQLLDD